jgi:hypothetical protein
MLDPLTALGLASNIVQLITFASGLVAKGRDIYQSTDGTLVEHLELEAITKSLEDLSLEVALPDTVSPNLTKVERQLQQLCDGCRKATKELLDVIQKLKAQGPHKRWASFRQALNSIWKEDEIQGLSVRLERYRRQIDTTLLLSLRETLQSTRTVPGQPYKPASQQVLGSVGESNKWQADFIDELQQQGWQVHSENAIGLFSSRLLAGAKEEREQLARLRILERLRFTSMKDRYEKIEEAHQKTFDWTLQEHRDQAVSIPVTANGGGSCDDRIDLAGQQSPKKIRKWDSFTQWLQSQQSLYWITGKPGSGKSTLMKYLYNDPRTLENLELWTRDNQITMAGFFFWNSGSSMQMSKMGLLQTLLYEALKGDPSSIPQLFRDRWRSYDLFGIDLHPWSWEELVLGFKLLISNNSRRFLFFIDGLDEFDGDTAELTQFVLEILSSRPNVKLCVASRPWLVFEDAFRRQPSLRLEDLTDGDIKLYVSEVLGENELFANLQRIKPQEAERLVIEVTGKSSGVFLWVRLVVLSLLEGLQDGDSIADLQNRLLLLPPDLEDLFQKILNRLNPFYFRQASRIFQLVRAASEPLTLLSLSFAEEGFEQCMSAPIKAALKGEVRFRTETMRRRLNSRCKGLLEAPTVEELGPEATVQYLHRTVKDFLARPDIWEYMLSGTQNSFDPDLTLSGAFLLCVKSTRPSAKSFDVFFYPFISCIKYSLRIEAKARDAHISILNELLRAASVALHPSSWQDDGLSTYAWPAHRCMETEQRSIDEDSLWWRDFRRSEEMKTFEEISVNNTDYFFVYAFTYPLYSYVQYKLSKGQSLNTKIGKNSLLTLAVMQGDLKMLQLLFDSGANPNNSEQGYNWTPWHQVLSLAIGSNKWAEIVKIFLDHGADPSAACEGKTAKAIIKERFQTWDPKWTKETLSTLEALKRSQKATKRHSHGFRALFKRGDAKK